MKRRIDFADIPADAHRARWMMFVDGENLTLRAQDAATKLGVEFRPGEFYRKDVFVWAPRMRGTTRMPFSNEPYILQAHAVRSFYYTSIRGDDALVATVRGELRDLGFHPEVFKKTSSTRRSKGVDIALAKDLLSNAFLGNFEAAVLVSGDGDYIPLIKEVQRIGRLAYVAAVSEGANPQLRIEADNYVELDGWLRQWWGSAA